MCWLLFHHLVPPLCLIQTPVSLLTLTMDLIEERTGAWAQRHHAHKKNLTNIKRWVALSSTWESMQKKFTHWVYCNTTYNLWCMMVEPQICWNFYMVTGPTGICWIEWNGTVCWGMLRIMSIPPLWELKIQGMSQILDSTQICGPDPQLFRRLIVPSIPFV